MTTIAATLEMMAADSRVNVGETSYPSQKLYRMPDGAIIGAGGDSTAIQRFVMWWPTQDLSKLRIPKRLDFECLVLTKEGLWSYSHSGPPDFIKDGVMAIGTGGEQALAAMDTMLLLKRKVDPRIAVKVACKRNQLTGEPIEWMRIK